MSSLYVPLVPPLPQRVTELKGLEVFFFKKQDSVAEWYRGEALEPNFVVFNSGPYLWDHGKVVINLCLGSPSVNYCEI